MKSPPARHRRSACLNLRATPPTHAKTTTACQYSQTSPPFYARSTQTCPGPLPPRGPCRNTASPPRFRNAHPAARSIRRSLPTRSATPVAPWSDSSRVPLPRQLRQVLNFLQQGFELRQRQRIRPIAQSLRRIVMHFQKDSVDPRRRTRACQRFNEFRLAATRLPLATGQLHRMRHIENHRIPQLAHDRKRPHIDHQILVAERCPALRQNNFFIP